MFLHYIVCMRANMRIGLILQSFQSLCGFPNKTQNHWYSIYTEILGKYLDDVDSKLIGGPDEVVAVDETAMRAKRIVQKPGTPGRKSTQTRTGHIEKRLPGRTVWKKLAAMKRPAAGAARKNTRTPQADTLVRKKPAGSVQKKPAGAETRWLWAAVELGPRNGRPRSHTDGTKRVRMQLLPEAANAADKKPRGIRSITAAMKDAIEAGTWVVSNEWRSTAPSTEAAGLRMAGQVCHAETFRDAATGAHK